MTCSSARYAPRQRSCVVSSASRYDGYRMSAERTLRKLLPNMGRDVSILAPFIVDYGFNCFIGDHSFINHGAYLMDCAPIRLGSHCFVGPSCGMYTAIHPLLAAERNTGLESARPSSSATTSG